MHRKKRTFQPDKSTNVDSDGENTEDRQASEILTELKDPIIPLDEARKLVGSSRAKLAKYQEEKRKNIVLNEVISRYQAFFDDGIRRICIERDELKSLNKQGQALISGIKKNN